MVSVVLLVVLAVGAATPGVLRARQERRLAGVASELAGRPVAVRCQAFGGAFVDASVELGYVRWRADGSPEDWTLLKRDARTARLLGAPAGEALALAVAYWRAVYPRMPDGYRSSACRPGGAMDEYLPDAPWTAAGV
jgi:hypothetical protein